MFCVIREYTMKSRLELDGLIEQVRSEFVPIISQARGFAAYSVTAADNGKLVTASFFSDRTGADDSVALAKDWVNRSVAASMDGPPSVTAGEVVLMDTAGNGSLGFGVMRRTKLKPGAKAEFIELLRGKIVPIAKQSDGFERMAAIDCGSDEIVVLAAYRDRASAEATGAKIMAFMGKNGMHLVTGPPDMLDGTIRLRHVNEAAFG